jgi:CRISPR-associated protein Csx10
MDKDYFDIEKPKPKLPSDRPQLQTSDGEKIAKDMAERILRRKLEYLLLDQVNSYKLEPNYLTNSQLSRLMLVARRSLDSLNSEHLTNLINELPSNALRQYEKTKVLKKSLNKQIEHWLEHPKEWLKNRVQEVRIAEQESSLTDELAQEYTFRLIMAIAKNALREGDNE